MNRNRASGAVIERCATGRKSGRKRQLSENEEALSGTDNGGGSSSEEDASEADGMESGTTSESSSSDSSSGSDSSSSSSSASTSNNEAMDALFQEDEFGRCVGAH